MNIHVVAEGFFMNCFSANTIETIFAFFILVIFSIMIFNYLKNKPMMLNFKQCKLHIFNKNRKWQIVYGNNKKSNLYDYDEIIGIDHITEDFFDENRYIDELASGHMIGGFEGFVAANDYAHNDSFNNNYYIILNMKKEDIKLLCSNKTEFDFNYSALKKIFK